MFPLFTVWFRPLLALAVGGHWSHGTNSDRGRAQATGGIHSQSHRVRMSHASGDRAERAGELSDLRHGPRATESRARRYETEVLDQPGLDHPGIHRRHGGDDPRPTPATFGHAADLDLG